MACTIASRASVLSQCAQSVNLVKNHSRLWYSTFLVHMRLERRMSLIFPENFSLGGSATLHVGWWTRDYHTPSHSHYLHIKLIPPKALWPHPLLSWPLQKCFLWPCFQHAIGLPLNKVLEPYHWPVFNELCLSSLSYLCNSLHGPHWVVTDVSNSNTNDITNDKQTRVVSLPHLRRHLLKSDTHSSSYSLSFRHSYFNVHTIIVESGSYNVTVYVQCTVYISC